MTITQDAVMAALQGVATPQGPSVVALDMVRALTIEGGVVRFVLEVPNAEAAKAFEPVRQACEWEVRGLPGVKGVTVAMTAPTAAKAPPPDLKLGRHPTPTTGGPEKVAGIGRILAIGSGKGGVGKSTVSSNVAVALARQGRRVGLLDADIYGPSQPRMMGVSQRPASPDGKTMLPLEAHGVKFMSIGLMLKEDQAVIWRGPMLQGALQQMISQVAWGDLDVLIIDLPPGTGDVQLSLCQKYQVGSAIVVSTPQDVALLDSRKALKMFETLKTPVAGLVENMSTYVCTNCGHEAHLFGHGGVAREAEKLGLPLLAELPLNIEVRLAGDAGTPIAATDSEVGAAYHRLAARLIADGQA